MTSTAQDHAAELLILEEMATYYADPMGFVMAAFPWGVPGSELELETGPDANQKRFLIDLHLLSRFRIPRG